MSLRLQQDIKKKTFKIQDIVVIGMMAASMEVAKLALSFLPNIELVSLFIIIFTLFLGNKVFYGIFVFVILEGFLYGFGLWWIMYLYCWPILALLTKLLHKQSSIVAFALLSGTYGLFFGALCSIPYLFIGGPVMFFSNWVTGIPFDIAHCLGNIIICFILFKPLFYIMERVTKENIDASL